MMEAARGKNDSAAAVVDDMRDGMMVMCSNHPYRNNLGGICAFCLQEKLGKLVSSSSFPFPFPILNSPVSSSSTPVSDVGSGSSAAAQVGSSVRKTPYSGFGGGNYPGSRPPNPVDRESSSAAARRTPRIPFLLARRKKKKKLPPCPSTHPPEAVLKRSKSSAAGPRRHFLGDNEDEYGYSPRTRRAGGGGGFWSFLHLSASSSSSSKSGASRRGDKPSAGSSKIETLSAFEEESPSTNGNGNGDQFMGFERKVSRSRSVGCGSRSFSGDFFERISTGFGDCTLRRVVSHREVLNSNRTPKQSQSQQPHKVYKCGGIFGGFMMIAAPSASSSYWVSDDHHHQVPGKPSALSNSHPRARSWNWAFPSPMRAFAKPNKDGKREINIIRDGSGKNPGPNLSAIPSLLAVGV